MNIISYFIIIASVLNEYNNNLNLYKNESLYLFCSNAAWPDAIFG